MNPESMDGEYYTEVTFQLRDRAHPMVDVSAALGCQVDLLEVVRCPDEPEQTVLFLRIHADVPEQIRELMAACDRADTGRIFGRNDGEYVAELSVRNCIANTAAKMRSILSGATATDGEATFTVVVPPGREPTDVVDAVEAAHPAAEVTSVRDRELAEPFLSRKGLQSNLVDELTSRQWEALYLAVTNGYFRRPREASQNELAEQMGIGQETFSQHLRAGQRRLFDYLFDEALRDEFEP